MQKTCYWCGKQATSVDHVPARSFYPCEMRKNLITVPACEEHNTGLAKLDERFRLYIQAASDTQVAHALFADTTLRSLQKPEATGFVNSLKKASAPALLSGQKTIAFQIVPREQNLFFEKICRGLYFHHMGSIFQGSIFHSCTHLVNPNVDYRELITIVQSCRGGLRPGNKTDDRVFKYEFGTCAAGSSHGFLIVAAFYECVTLFGFGLFEGDELAVDPM